MIGKSISRLAVGVVALVLSGGTYLAAVRGEDTPRAHYVTLRDSAAMDTAALDRAIAPLFDEDMVGTTQSLLIMRDGEVIAERYADGFGPDTRLLSRSIAKAVSAVLVGLMVSDGRLALDSPVPLDRWNQPGDPRGQITLRHLLTMTSGLEHREMGDPLARADTVRMLFTDGAGDMAGYAQAKPVAAPPGSHFVYSTANTLILCDLMSRMLTDRDTPDARRAAMEEFMRGRLAEPVGLDSMIAEYDARGTMIGGAMMYMTTRDYARFGEFLLNRGRANGRQILSPRWVGFMTSPSPRNPAYGGGVWLNREGNAGSPMFPGRGPRSVFAAVGHHGQYVVVSPAQRLVIVRMGVTPADRKDALAQEIGKLVEAFPTG